MTAYAIYFSPTRTSERIARAIARGTGADEVIDVDLTHDASRVTLPASALAVIAIPVYGGHLPPLAAERLRGLQGSGTPAVAVVVYGNRAYENALTELAALAGAAGLNVIAAAKMKDVMIFTGNDLIFLERNNIIFIKIQSNIHSYCFTTIINPACKCFTFVIR